jgi:hypothetical protein
MGGVVNAMAVLPLLIATAAAWLVYAIPHLIYHVAHPLDASADQVANVAVLASQVLLRLVGLVGVSTLGCRRPVV